MGLITFGILGPVEVRVSGSPVTVGGPRVQAVLAALLLRAGERVSADGLIDLVWGDEPPSTARAALQMHVSKLRRRLEELGAEGVLVTHGSAYAIEVDAEQLDATRFRRLVEEGRALLGASDPASAARGLTEALGLWRGLPLEGLELPGLAPGELRELEDLRQVATILRLEAELAIGRHLEIVPELTRLRAELPLDERVAEVAATALARAGRQADALAELAALRRELSEQLGMEPGPSITELERRIVTADPSLAPAPDSEPPSARELRKTVTALALRLPPGDVEDVRAATEALAGVFASVVQERDGWYAPARSGRLVAVFGIPSAHEDDAERAVTAAATLRREATAIGHDPRIAVATGEVLVEVAGDRVELLTHDPVEVADQLARKARGGEVLVGEATHRLVRAIADVDPSPVMADDERGQVVAYPLLDVAETPVPRRVGAPMTGRDAETLRLRDAAQRALAERRPTLITVVGAAGVGKSRLVAEFTASLGDRVEVATGRCLPYGRDIGMWPVAEVVRSIVQIREGVTVRSARRRLASFLADQPEGDALEEQLAWLIGLAERGAAPDETSWAVRRFLEGAARRRPLVVVIEDLQWADDALIDLLGSVTVSASRAALVFVAVARPELVERRPTWGSSGADATTVRLEPLDAGDADDLLVRLLGTSELDAEVRVRITSSTEGNPLFLEEVVSSLIDDGYLRERAGRWEPTGDLASVPLPPTVKGLLEARVDHLPDAERDVLEAAAIVGREFDDEDLEDLRPDTKASDVAAALDALCRRDLVEVRRFSRPGTRSYAFRHALIHDVVAGATPRDRRARDHELFGRALAARAGDRLAEVQEIVGYHLEIAFQLRQGLSVDREATEALGALAVAHLTAAGRRAVGRDDAAAAASLFGRALACAGDDDGVRGELARRRGAALFDLGRFAEAEEAFHDGLEEAERCRDEALRMRLELERRLADLYLHPGHQDVAQTRSFASEAVASLRAAGDGAGAALASRLLGEALLIQGRIEEANEAFLDAWHLAEAAGEERELISQPQIAGLHGPTPLDVYVEQGERSLLSVTRPRPETLMRLALAHALMGHDEDANRLIDEGLARAHDVGGAFRVADAEMHAGAARLALGEPAAAAASLRNTVEMLGAIGERNVRSTALALLGEAWFRLARPDDALAAAEESRDEAADDDRASQMAWRQVQAKVLAARGELDAARTTIEEAIAIADGTDFLTMAGFAHLDAWHVLTAAGDPEAAAEQRRTAEELFAHKRVAPEVVARTFPDGG